MSVNSLGAVALHALSYDHRDEADQYGVLYSGLNSCQVSSTHGQTTGCPICSFNMIRYILIFHHLA